jgi:hypothetical protein
VCKIKNVQLFTGAENKRLFALFSIPAFLIAWFSAVVGEMCPFIHREGYWKIWSFGSTDS